MSKVYTMEQKVEIVKKINERIKSGQSVRIACEAENVANANYYRWLQSANLTRIQTKKVGLITPTKKPGKLAIIYGETNDIIDALRRL